MSEHPLHQAEEWAKHHPIAVAIGAVALTALFVLRNKNQGTIPSFVTPQQTGSIPIDASPVQAPISAGFPVNPPQYVQMPYRGQTGNPFSQALYQYAAQSASTVPAACGNFTKCKGVFGCIGNFFKQTATCGFRIAQTGALYAGGGYASTGALPFGGIGGNTDNYGGFNPGYEDYTPFTGTPFNISPDYNSLPQYPIPGIQQPSPGYGIPGVSEAVYHPAMAYTSNQPSSPGTMWI